MLHHTVQIRTPFFCKTYIQVCAHIEERRLLVGVLLFLAFRRHSLLRVDYALGGRIGHKAENWFVVDVCFQTRFDILPQEP